MNVQSLLSVARFACLETLRTKTWVLAGAVIVVVWALAEFGASLAITESAAHRIVFYAASVRIGVVFLVGLVVTASVLRDIDDKGVDMSLSRPITRGDWYLGKFAAYALLSVCLAAVAAIPLVIESPAATLAWWLALVFELLIVTAAALALAITLRQVPAVISLLAGFYLLSRAISAIVLMSTGPTVDLSLLSAKFIAYFVRALAYLLPDLDRFADSAWLIDGAPAWTLLGDLAVQTLLTVGLLLSVGLFDLYRRNF